MTIRVSIIAAFNVKKIGGGAARHKDVKKSDPVDSVTAT